MKIIVTHSSPDMDAITSVWLIRKFLMGWENAIVQFVPAGERLGKNALRSPRQFKNSSDASAPAIAGGDLGTRSPSATLMKNYSHAEAPRATDTIEIIDGHEVIHVDTGLGPLDHHQTASDKVCAASLTFDFVKRVSAFAKASADKQNSESKKSEDRMDAVRRMVKVIVDIDHFKEVFWEDATADYHEFSVAAILDGLKLQKQDQDDFYVEFISDCLDAILHEFENRIWAEEEIKNNGVKFNARYGKGIGFETINDSVIKLAQKMGYVIVVRKDPRKGYVRIKARPSGGRLVDQRLASSSKGIKLYAKRYTLNADIDLTLAYEKLKKMDPGATWFLHISKKMLLNGSVKNPKMRPTRLGLNDIIGVLEKI